jgi:hypothetical protein
MSVTEHLTAAERDVAAKIASKRAGQEKFDNLRAQAGRLLAEATAVAILYDLGDLPIEQVRAVQKLIAVDLRDLPLSPEGDDFRDLANDLISLTEAIDPLISAIGEHARYHASLGTITKRDHEHCFATVIRDAIEGNALCCLEQCAEAADQEMLEAAE